MSKGNQSYSAARVLRLNVSGGSARREYILPFGNLNNSSYRFLQLSSCASLGKVKMEVK